MKMYSYRNFIIVLVFLFAGFTELNAAILPVPSEPYPTIQSAIDAADPNDTVQVAPGYYPENIVFPGYDITLTAYDPNCYADTIINAERSGAVVTFNGGETNACILRGFTITGGMTGGIRAVNSSPTIQSCHVVNNYDTSSLAAGIFLSGNCSPVIYNCSITSNYPTRTAAESMGGIYCYNGVNLTLTNCSLIHNGIPFYPDNNAQIYCHTSQVSAINCMIWNQARNEIIEDAGTVTARYCDIEGGWPGIGNIDQNPELVGVDFARYDFHLEYSSPCIDRGDPNTQFILTANDPDGDPRIHNGRIDIGADEFVDTDTDWLPDWWEKKFFASSTAADTYGNLDNDAYVNHQEYSMNTNPITTHFYVNDSTGSDAWNGAAPVWDGQHGPCKTIIGGLGRMFTGDTLLVAPGIYQGYNNRDIRIWLGITVKSTDGPETCIIDCQGSAADPHGGFTIIKEYGSTEPEAVLEGFTIKNGYSTNEYSPAGIWIYGASPTIRNCIITENTSESGVGITGGAGIRCTYYGYNLYPQPQIIDCEISHNQTNQYGGGIFADYYFYLTLNRCLIHHNHASMGGGIAITEGLIQSSTIADNTSVGPYSGIFVHDYVSYIQAWNSICWNNDSMNVGFWYSDVQGSTLPTNFDADPLFADPANDDYHLKSQAGRWDPQLQKWAYDDVTSPCIDLARRDENWKAELWPRGKRNNLGVYGGTREASMSLSVDGNPADLNLDDIVNFADYYLWSARWLEQQNFLHEDFNRNGSVDVPDAGIFSENWLWSKPCLIGYWNMDETSGTIAHDGSGFASHGTLHGDAAWTSGHSNNALLLDGNGDYVELGNKDILKPEFPISYSAWVNRSSTATTQVIFSADGRNIGNDNKFYGTEILISSVGNIFVAYDNGIGSRYKRGATTLDTDTWYHVAAVIRGRDDIEVYLNGNNDNGTYGGSAEFIAYTHHGSCYIGCGNGSDAFFHGLLDDVRIYNCALTEDEIQALADN